MRGPEGTWPFIPSFWNVRVARHSGSAKGIRGPRFLLNTDGLALRETSMTRIDETSAVTALAALAQASRLAVFRLLVQAAPDGAFPGDIATQLDLPPNTLSFHLKTLAHAGLVSTEQQGRYIRYRANTAQMQHLVGYLTDNCCGGDSSKCAPACAPKAAHRDGRRVKAAR